LGLTSRAMTEHVGPSAVDGRTGIAAAMNSVGLVPISTVGIPRWLVLPSGVLAAIPLAVILNPLLVRA